MKKIEEYLNWDFYGNIIRNTNHDETFKNGNEISIFKSFDS